MRGKVTMTQKLELARRITPAYAGKSHSVGQCRLVLEDHPRLCGEKVRVVVIKSRFRRITPAYAGKSCTSTLYESRFLDHPRLCGEKDEFVAGENDLAGSPPPMRGKVFLAPFVLSVIRITPAYAGKSHSKRIRERISGDHPRLCGEKRFL